MTSWLTNSIPAVPSFLSGWGSNSKSTAGANSVASSEMIFLVTKKGTYPVPRVNATRLSPYLVELFQKHVTTHTKQPPPPATPPVAESAASASDAAARPAPINSSSNDNNSGVDLITTSVSVPPLTVQLLAEHFDSVDVMNWLSAYLSSSDPSTAARQIARGIREDEPLALLMLAAEELRCALLLEHVAQFVSALLRVESSPEPLRSQFGIASDFSVDDEQKWRSAGVWDDSDDARQEQPLARVSRSVADYKRASQAATFTEALTLEILQPRHSSSVISDEAVTHCLQCGKQFGVTVRRHHCRSCGRIFCAECAAGGIELPPPDVVSARQLFQSPHFGARMWWWVANGFNSKLVRVCVTCREEIRDQHKYRLFIQGFERLALELPLLKRAVTVSRKWRCAAMTSFRALLEIQYRLPMQELEPREQRLLWNNRQYWPGHSKWLLQLMKVVQWQKLPDAHEALALLRAPQRCSCKELLCSRMCTRELSAGDALELLSEQTQFNDAVRTFAVQRLSTASNEELLCYLPLLVHDVRFEPVSGSPLWQFLLNKALEDNPNSNAHPDQQKQPQQQQQQPQPKHSNANVSPSMFVNDLYWALMVSCECEVPNVRRRYGAYVQQLIATVTARFGLAYAQQLIGPVALVAVLESVSLAEKNASVVDVLQQKSRSLDLSVHSPLMLPIDPRVRITGIDPRQSRVKESMTAPLVVACHVTPDSHLPPPAPASPSLSSASSISAVRQYQFMFKREDVRKDYLVTSLIRLMDMLLRKHDQDLHVLTYRVVPTSRQAGFVEMVQHAETLYDVGNISHYITQYNGTRTIDEVRSVFQRSLAAYSVISYLLGLGDRHMENIMVTSSGVLFHIDYGYILGRDPKPMMPYMRLTQSMVDAMGGHMSKHYMQFKVTAINAYMTLRRYTPLFFNLLLLMVRADPPIAGGGYTLEELQNQVRMRFLPGHMDTDAEATLRLRMDQSFDAISGSMADTIHTYNKETFSKGMTYVWSLFGTGRPSDGGSE